MPVQVPCEFNEGPVKIKALSCPQHFLYNKTMGIFFGAQEASNSNVFNQK